jgi:DNA-binding response OmpR family regulator
LSKLLIGEGLVPAVCSNGAQAIDYARQNSPVAALVDIHLPDISGLVLAGKLRERFGDATPIIVLSGDTSMENIRSLSHVGATYFISKPVNGEHLIERLRDLVSSSPRYPGQTAG